MRLISSPSLTRALYGSFLLANATPAICHRAAAVSAPRIAGLEFSTMPRLGSLFGLGSSSSSSSQKQDMSDFPVQKSDQEWRAVLNKEQFRILRQKGTEPPGSGEYDKHYPDEGVYSCAGCATPLYKAGHKFKSGCGWPAYFDAIPGAVTRHTDRSFGMDRTEIVCSNCGGHLGHVFKGEGFKTPTDERHCVNSISLKFSKDDPTSGESKA